MVVFRIKGVYIAGSDSRWVIVVELLDKVWGMNILPGLPQVICIGVTFPPD